MDTIVVLVGIPEPDEIFAPTTRSEVCESAVILFDPLVHLPLCVIEWSFVVIVFTVTSTGLLKNFIRPNFTFLVDWTRVAITDFAISIFGVSVLFSS
jgi:hypothetical protein